jgi:small subunit ribosomal protein S6
MPFYESVFIARQDISGAQAEAITESLSKVIEDNGGKVVKTESWGLRALAYKIKKNRKGHYVLLGVDAPSAAIHEMDRQMKLNEDIIRQLILRVDEIEEGPSIILRNKDTGEKRRPQRNHDAGNATDGPPQAKKASEDTSSDGKPDDKSDDKPDEKEAEAVETPVEGDAT